MHKPETMKESPTIKSMSSDMDPPQKRDSWKKKRSAKTRVMNLALETLGSER